MTQFKLLSLIALFLLINSCYYTAQSYNNGTLLDPGDATFTFGAGGTRQSTEMYNDARYNMTWEEDTTVPYYINEQKMWRSIAIGYQLGIHDRYPFGGGLEFGLLWEGQYTKVTDYYGSSVYSDILPCVDFNTRFGFKDIVTENTIYQHNVELGWTVGMWLDNGVFLGYSGGWEYEKCIPYIGVRGILMPTNLVEAGKFPGEDDFWEYHDQKYNLRFTGGITLKIKDLRFIPDLITPELSITTINGSPHEKVNANFHIGFQWTNGL